MLKIKCLFVCHCTVDHLPNKRDVVRMHPVEHDFNRGPVGGVVPEYLVALLGPDDFSVRDVPAKTAGVAKPLRFCQIGLADLQRGVKFLEIPHLILQISARPTKRLGCISLRSNQSNDKETRHCEQGNAR
ncbi:MAG TPA: hypothetical protein VK148_21040 [Xanthobacteraceae bacterium]|nr:hypothetical protein [Xanthobacteraceae bacterium]